MLNNTHRDKQCMESHDLLSTAQRLYLTSQVDEITNLSEQKSRIAKNVDKIFNTMQIILDSKNIEQEFKDSLFTPQKISVFIYRLTHHDPENTTMQEANKEIITIDLMKQALSYFQSKYKEVFIKKEIKIFEQFADDIIKLTQKKIEETEAQKMYKSRKSLLPPLLPPKNDTWTALCIQCLAYTTLGENKDDSIKRVRHSTNCLYHKANKEIGKENKKQIYSQFFKIIPPKKKN